MAESRPGRPEVFLPDVNVLVALTNPAHVHHAQAHRWLSNVERFATTPLTENGLVRLLLNPAVTGQQVSGQRAIGILAGVRADRRATFLPDASSLSAPLIDVVGLVGHRQATDFHLINLAALHEATLVTFDRRITQSLVALDRRLVRVLD